MPAFRNDGTPIPEDAEFPDAALDRIPVTVLDLANEWFGGLRDYLTARGVVRGVLVADTDDPDLYQRERYVETQPRWRERLREALARLPAKTAGPAASAVRRASLGERFGLDALEVGATAMLALPLPGIALASFRNQLSMWAAENGKQFSTKLLPGKLLVVRIA